MKKYSGFTRTRINFKEICGGRGFTLIELLVVISIISILSVVGFVSYQNVTLKAKDAKMKADIDAIKKAYETNYIPEGQGRYQPLADSQFASGKIPTQPNGSPYPCIVGPESTCTFQKDQGYKVSAPLSTGTSYATSTGGTLGGTINSCDPASVLGNGLVGYWKMDDITGGNTTDTIGTKNGTLTNDTGGSLPTLTAAGKLGSALNFSRVNKSFVNIKNISALCPTSITITGWFSRTETGYAHTIVGNWWNGWGRIQVTTGNKLTWAWIPSTGVNKSLTSSGSISTNTWYHFAATFDLSTQQAKLYINGQQDPATGTSSSTIQLGGAGACSYAAIGATGVSYAQYPNDVFWFNGQMDDIRIYNRALSSDEISLLYNGGQGCALP